MADWLDVLLEGTAEEREAIDARLRQKLATLYELLPHTEEVSNKDVQGKLDAAGLEELLPYWRNAIGSMVERFDLNLKPSEEFVAALMAALELHVLTEAMKIAGDKELDARERMRERGEEAGDTLLANDSRPSPDRSGGTGNPQRDMPSER